MKKNYSVAIAVFISLGASLLAQSPVPSASPAASPDKPKQFMYVLRPVPRLYDEKAWTKGDAEIITKHFERLKEATKTGKSILAGRTMESGERTFGIVVFEAKDADEARTFMEADPAVKGGIMTAELHPFFVALERKIQ